MLRKGWVDLTLTCSLLCLIQKKKKILPEAAGLCLSAGSPTVRELQTGGSQTETVFLPKALQCEVKLEREKLS